MFDDEVEEEEEDDDYDDEQLWPLLDLGLATGKIKNIRRKKEIEKRNKNQNKQKTREELLPPAGV